LIYQKREHDGWGEIIRDMVALDKFVWMVGLIGFGFISWGVFRHEASIGADTLNYLFRSSELLRYDKMQWFSDRTIVIVFPSLVSQLSRLRLELAIKLMGRMLFVLSVLTVGVLTKTMFPNKWIPLAMLMVYVTYIPVRFAQDIFPNFWAVIMFF